MYTTLWQLSSFLEFFTRSPPPLVSLLIVDGPYSSPAGLSLLTSSLSFCTKDAGPLLAARPIFMQTRSVGVSLAADRPRERYHYDGMTSSVNLALRASPPGHIRAISLNSEENASPQGQNFPRQRTTYSRSRSTGSALPSTPLTALFTGSDRPQVAPGPSVVKVPSVLAIVTQFEDQASVYAASGGNSTHQRRPPTPPDASSYTRTSSFSSVVWPSPSTSRIAAVPRKTPFPNLDSVLPVGQKGRRPRRNLTRPSADVPALCSSVSNVTSNSNSISFEQSSPPHFSTAPSSVSSSVHSGPYHSHSSSSEAEAEIFPHDEISEQFRTILEDEDFDPPLAHGFRKVWKMLDSIGDALLVEMLPPNLGEVLPESLSSSELRSVQHVAYKVVSYLDALRRDMHVELRRVRKIHQLELPDLRRIKSYRDLSNACKVWRDRLS